MPDFNFPQYHFILASKSPRRLHLLKELGLNFEVQCKDVDESYPAHLKAEEIPLYLCRKKAEAFEDCLVNSDNLVITADTIVWVEGQVLNKPVDAADAKRMLRLLSGKMHEVFTGVCLKTKHKSVCFHSATKVYFKNLSEEEIDYYVRDFKPFDKAGAYGAQEWIGYIAIERIEGSYFNVMGLPLFELQENLLRF